MPDYGTSERLALWLFRSDGSLATILRENGTRDVVVIPLTELALALATTGASHIFMVHHHPSGDPTPSRADVEGTRRVWRLARTLGASLQDHLVIAGTRNYSFRAQGLL